MPKPIEKRASEIHGNGVFALQDIPKGTEIVEYKGKRISHDEADSNLRTGDPDSGHTFLFTLNDHWIIDATRKGNIARWINQLPAQLRSAAGRTPHRPAQGQGADHRDPQDPQG